LRANCDCFASIRKSWPALSVTVVLAGALLLPSCVAIVPLTSEWPPPGYISGEIPSEYAGLRNPFALQDERALDEGAGVYRSGLLACLSCHGANGRGTGPRWTYLDVYPADFAAGPMLNAFRQHQDYVYWWVSEGVPPSEMPAYKDILSPTERWAVITYAWYLGEQTIGNVPSRVEKAATPIPQTVPGGRAEQGRLDMEKYGCGACHVIPGVPGANGTFGPSLVDFAERKEIAGVLPNTPDNLIRWLQNPPAVKPGTAMPNLGVTEPDARDIGAYLYTLK